MPYSVQSWWPQAATQLGTTSTTRVPSTPRKCTDVASSLRQCLDHCDSVPISDSDFDPSFGSRKILARPWNQLRLAQSLGNERGKLISTPSNCYHRYLVVWHKLITTCFLSSSLFKAYLHDFRNFPSFAFSLCNRLSLCASTPLSLHIFLCSSCEGISLSLSTFLLVAVPSASTSFDYFAVKYENHVCTPLLCISLCV